MGANIVHRDGVVGIATCYELESPVIKSFVWRVFPHLPIRPWCSPSLLFIGNQVFPGGNAVGAWR
jgi:hypothetical protein